MKHNPVTIPGKFARRWQLGKGSDDTSTIHKGMGSYVIPVIFVIQGAFRLPKRNFLLDRNQLFNLPPTAENWESVPVRECFPALESNMGIDWTYFFKLIITAILHFQFTDSLDIPWAILM